MTFKIIVGSLSLPSITDKVFKKDSVITSFTLPAATGGSGNKTYTCTGLPTGLTFTASSRQVSGTPTASVGAYTVVYRVTDSSTPTQTAQRTFVIRVANMTWSKTQVDLTFI